MKYFLILIFTFLTLNCFAYFSYEKQSHSFVFHKDGSIVVSPITNGDYTGFGYFLNDDYSTFYQISEADINKALTFKENDRVQFVRNHKDNAFHKTTLWKQDKQDSLNNIYKIGGKGNGDIKFVIKEYKPSGQPLPGVFYSIVFVVLSLLFIKKMYNKS